MRIILLTTCLLVCCACERVPEEEAASLVPLRLSGGTATNALPTPVFDLVSARLDAAQAASNGVQVSALDDVCMLECERAGVGVTIAADKLPLGSAPRTLLVMLRSAQPAPAMLAGYGVAGTQGRMSALVLDHAARLSFWGYGADVWCDLPAPTQRWTCVAATYNGTALTLYVDGAEVKSAAVALDTPATALRIGEKFTGAISDVRIWDVALRADEVTAAYVSSLTRLR